MDVHNDFRVLYLDIPTFLRDSGSMCGRFSLSKPATVDSLFGLTLPPEIRARYNIAPSQQVLILMNDGEKRFELARWGLIPSWAKDPAIGNSLINARGETINEKPSFRQAFKK